MPTLSLPAHQSPPLLRRVVVAAVLVAYALPLSLNALSGLSHGAFHMLDRVQERQARAAAMGLVHLSEQGRERSTFVHTHDGSTHAHAGPVDALLSASDHADDQQDVAAPVVKLATHAPAMVVRMWLAPAVSRAFTAVELPAPDHPRPLPPLPPPRG